MPTNLIQAKGASVARTLQQELRGSFIASYITNERLRDNLTHAKEADLPYYPKISVYNETDSYAKIRKSDLNPVKEKLIVDTIIRGNFVISDVDMAQLAVDPKSKLITDLRDDFSKKYDVKVLNEFANAAHTVNAGSLVGGTGTGGIDITNSDTVFKMFTATNRIMDKHDIPSGQRWIVVNAETKEALELSNRVVRDTSLGDKIITGGLLGEILGIKIYFSNNLPTTPTKHFLAGQGKPIDFVRQKVPTVTIVGSNSNSEENVTTFKMESLYGVKTFRDGGNRLLDILIA